MRVGTLRKMLDEKGLDVDGSRESMIALLKENMIDWHLDGEIYCLSESESLVE